ncbi:hypothetical protein [Campylobacter sp. 7477a]|uniref:hypothetical protein n=1 Tax=Campylobacter sp. 7477a TaxID=2735741 RepID=UPI0030145C74|nr:hypothetical protein [Campylobacter sp. 7477a]
MLTNISPSPTSGETIPPRKNGQKPSIADAEPAYSLPQFIASAEDVGSKKPVKNIWTKKQDTTNQTSSLNPKTTLRYTHETKSPITPT